MTYETNDYSAMSPAMRAMHTSLLLHDESAWIPQGTRQQAKYDGPDALLAAHSGSLAGKPRQSSDASIERPRPQNATGLLATDWAIDDYTTWK